MYLNKIKIQNFRNYEEQTIDLNKDINIFYGYNAQGKTNILESVFLCAFGKSFRTNKEKEMIKKGEKYANIEVEYQKKDRNGKIKINISEKKVIYLNNIKIKKFKGGIIMPIPFILVAAALTGITECLDAKKNMESDQSVIQLIWTEVC